MRFPIEFPQFRSGLLLCIFLMLPSSCAKPDEVLLFRSKDSNFIFLSSATRYYYGPNLGISLDRYLGSEFSEKVIFSEGCIKYAPVILPRSITFQGKCFGYAVKKISASEVGIFCDGANECQGLPLSYFPLLLKYDNNGTLTEFIIDPSSNFPDHFYKYVPSRGRKVE